VPASHQEKRFSESVSRLAISRVDVKHSRVCPKDPKRNIDKRVETSPDNDLVEEIRRREREAEEALFEKYAARVYYLALSELRSHPDAETCARRPFLRVLQSILATASDGPSPHGSVQAALPGES
jgi:hypothetical protein